MRAETQEYKSIVFGFLTHGLGAGEQRKHTIELARGRYSRREIFAMTRGKVRSPKTARQRVNADLRWYSIPAGVIENERGERQPYRSRDLVGFTLYATQFEMARWHRRLLFRQCLSLCLT